MSLIEGVDSAAVDDEVISRYLERYGLPGKGGATNRKIRILVKHFGRLQGEETPEQYQSCTCSTCQGESPGILSECPFCGDAETDESAKVKPKEEDLVELPPIEKKEAVEGKNGVVKRKRGRPPGPSKKKTKAEAEVEETEAEEAPVKKKRGRPPGSKKKVKAKTETPEDAPVVKRGRGRPKKIKSGEVPETEAVVVDVDEKYSEQDLDQSVETCQGFMKEAARNVYALGRELKRINDSNLYLLRTTERGGRAYTNFKVFTQAEFGITGQHAYNLMLVAEHFTEAQVKEMGVTKLRLIRKLPPEIRREIMDAAEDGETIAELSERADKLQGKEKPTKTLDPQNALMAILKLGQLTATAYKSPTKPGKTLKKTKPARSGENCFSVHHLENEVDLIVHAYRKDDGTLEHSVTFKRNTEE